WKSESSRTQSSIDESRPISKTNLFDFVEVHLVSRSIVKLRGSRRLMGGDLLGVFERASVQQIGGDAGRSECMTADRRGESSEGGPPFDHRQSFATVEPMVRQALLAVDRSK